MGGGVGAGVLEPGGQVFECVPPGYVVHKQRARRASVVGAGYGSEALLPGRVPNLEFYLFLVDRYHSCAELHTYNRSKEQPIGKQVAYLWSDRGPAGISCP